VRRQIVFHAGRADNNNTLSPCSGAVSSASRHDDDDDDDDDDEVMTASLQFLFRWTSKLT